GLRNWATSRLDMWFRGFRDWLSVHVPDFVAAVIILVVGYKLSSTAAKYAGRPVYRWVNRPSVARTTLRLIRYVIFIFSVLLALRVAFNLTLTSFLLTATVFSAVVGIVLAPS
ncbi:MAG: hypothetical protein SV760_02260, partial [Halobacteria archaeon]|nr:hypothetical protein [Halobacteria archaeon]